MPWIHVPSTLRHPATPRERAWRQVLYRLAVPALWLACIWCLGFMVHRHRIQTPDWRGPAPPTWPAPTGYAGSYGLSSFWTCQSVSEVSRFAGEIMYSGETKEEWPTTTRRLTLMVHGAGFPLSFIQMREYQSVLSLPASSDRIEQVGSGSLGRWEYDLGRITIFEPRLVGTRITVVNLVSLILDLASVLLLVGSVGRCWIPLRSVYRHHRARCMACGYPLAGIATGVCPECGSVRVD
jgi:hypothetical protein